MTTHKEAVEKLIMELQMLSTIARESKFKYNFTINDVYFQMANELIEFSAKIELITIEEANSLKQTYTTK